MALEGSLRAGAIVGRQPGMHVVGAVAPHSDGRDRRFAPVVIITISGARVALTGSKLKRKAASVQRCGPSRRAASALAAAAGDLRPCRDISCPRRIRPVTPPAGTGRARYSAEHVRLARRVVGTLSGRYSMELGIDVDAGGAEIERWFLAATLFGTRISAPVAERNVPCAQRCGPGTDRPGASHTVG